MEKKSMQKSIKKLMHLGIDFWKDFGGFWEGKWSQVGTKIHQTLVSVAKRIFFFFIKKTFSQLISIFNRFWCQLGSIFLPKIH